MLKPRLLTAAGFIRFSDRVLDIGTDHARLPVYLLEHGLCNSVTATELSEGPLLRASRTIRIHHLEDQIELLLRDGAEGLDPSAFDTVVIAGMGADTILSIVRKNPWFKEKRLITQPQTRIRLFPEMMAEEGYSLFCSQEATEGKRVYHIFVFNGGSA